MPSNTAFSEPETPMENTFGNTFTSLWYRPRTRLYPHPKALGDAMTDTTDAEHTCAKALGAVTGGPRTMLRLEGLALFLGMTLLYWCWDGSWWIYAALFLAPDLSFLGYLRVPC